MKYEHLERLGREEAEQRLRSSDMDEVRRAVAVLSGVDDASWAKEELLRLLEHADYWVAGNAVIGLSDMVRMGLIDDVTTLRKRLLCLTEERPELDGHIESALGDIDLFSGKTKNRK